MALFVSRAGTRRQEPILVLGDMQVDGRRSEGVSSDSAEYTSMINILRVCCTLCALRRRTTS